MIDHQQQHQEETKTRKNKIFFWIGVFVLIVLLLGFFFWRFADDFSLVNSSDVSVSEATTTEDDRVQNVGENETSSVLARSYTNERFGYRLGLPRVFTNVNRSQNSDGAVFTNQAKTASLRVYGSNNVLDETITDLVDQAREGFQKVVSVDRRENAAIITGIGEDGWSRREYILLENENIYRMRLSYSGKVLSADMVEDIIDSFELFE